MFVNDASDFFLLENVNRRYFKSAAVIAGYVELRKVDIITHTHLPVVVFQSGSKKTGVARAAVPPQKYGAVNSGIIFEPVSSHSAQCKLPVRSLVHKENRGHYIKFFGYRPFG